jgi:hypothetical protein
MGTNRRAFIGIMLVALSAAACARTRRAAEDETLANAPALLVVKNNNFLDMDIFVAPDGGRPLIRLGTATGNSTASFKVDRMYFPTGTVAFVANPIGGTGTARTGPLSVSGGQTITFLIQPELAQSTATVAAD